MNPDHHDWLTQGRAGFLSCVREYVVNCRWARCIEGQEVATSTWRSVVNGVCSPSAESSYCRRTTLSERTVNQWSLAQRVILVVLGSEVTSPERQRQTTACRKQCSGSSRQGWWWSGGGGEINETWRVGSAGGHFIRPLYVSYSRGVESKEIGRLSV